MLAAIENYNLSEVNVMRETYANGQEYFKDNAKNVAMQVYHDKTVKNENKLHTEADCKNTRLLKKIIM